MSNTKKRYTNLNEFISAWTKAHKANGTREDVLKALNSIPDVRQVKIGAITERESKIRDRLKGLKKDDEKILPRLRSAGSTGTKMSDEAFMALFDSIDS